GGPAAHIVLGVDDALVQAVGGAAAGAAAGSRAGAGFAHDALVDGIAVGHDDPCAGQYRLVGCLGGLRGDGREARRGRSLFKERKIG
nr:hypothetical protein [Tanacetum cinerariifolium]